MQGLRRSLIAAMLVLIGARALTSGQVDGFVPANLQAVLFSKILSFDRNLTSAAGARLEVVVVYQREFPESRDIADQFSAAFPAGRIADIGGRPLSITSLSFATIDDLTTALAQRKVDVVYIAPLRAVNVRRLTQVVGGRAKIITGVRDYVDDGAAVGVQLRGGKPHIVVNLEAARAQGMDLSAQLLKLAEVIGS